MLLFTFPNLMYYLNIPNRTKYLEKSHFHSCDKNTLTGCKCSETVCCVVGLSVCDVSTDGVNFIFLDFLNPDDDSTLMLQTLGHTNPPDTASYTARF